ncbi:MAG: GDSL-type esterase/lipase family protein [Candidatus Nealsonbacteria bacterium]|nr:GDSL-type esterase/lipase family protein [Candidatus Nealsonbacteria bacterium]
MNTFLVFGDSIAWGAYDSEEGGWVGRLKIFLEKERSLQFELYNLAVDGDITTNLSKRFDSETKSRIKEGSETIIIFAIGINDSYFIKIRNDFITPPEEFKKNIKKLITLAGKFSSKVIFIGLTPVDELKVTPIPWNADLSYRNENIKKYDEIIKKTCEEENAEFVEIFDKLIKSGDNDLLEDGLHPNSKGHKKIFEGVKDFLIFKKII